MLQLFSYNSYNKTAILAIKTNAKNNEIQNFIIINNKSYLKLNIKSSPENGKANQEIIDFLSQKWKIYKQNIQIMLGHSSNIKLITIKNIELALLDSYLQQYKIN